MHLRHLLATLGLLILILFIDPTFVSMERSVNAKARLEQVVGQYIENISMYDPRLAEEAQELLSLFSSRFVPASVLVTERTFSPISRGTCRIPSGCFTFGLAPPSIGTAGRWDDLGEALVVMQNVSDDPISVFVVLHELRHAQQYLDGQPLDPLPRSAGDPWAREADAMAFEIRLLHASTAGRFGDLVGQLVAAHRVGLISSVTRNGIVYPRTNGIAEELFPEISSEGRNVVDVAIIHTFNLVLGSQADDVMTSNLQMGLRDPDVIAFMSY